MRILIAKDDQTFIETTSLDAVRASLEDQDTLIWVDLYHDTSEESRQVMIELFNFHPLSVDDALVEIHVPKIDNWGDYLYLSLIAVKFDQPLDDIDKAIELDVFLGSNFLVTYHHENFPAVDVVWNQLLRNENHPLRSSKLILYQIIDQLADEYMKMIDFLDMRIDQLEEPLIEKPNRKLLEEVFTIKRSLLNLRRIVVPQSEVLNKLSRGDFEIIALHERMYFRDVYDHLARVHEIIENLREIISSVLDIYLSVINNRLNSTIKTLTIITTLFMLLSLVNEFFGVNIFAADNQLTRWSGEINLGLIIAVAFSLLLIMFLWMRRRDLM